MASWPLRVTLSGRNIFSEEYYFDANSESADPGPPRQILLSTTIRLRLGPHYGLPRLVSTECGNPTFNEELGPPRRQKLPRTPLENT